jgi:hypothetical protein
MGDSRKQSSLWLAVDSSDGARPICVAAGHTQGTEGSHELRFESVHYRKTEECQNVEMRMLTWRDGVCVTPWGCVEP